MISLLLASLSSSATPANKAAFKRHYDRFLPAALNNCATCHLPSAKKNPETLAEFPHNPFGNRLRVLGEELAAQGKPASLGARLDLAAKEDSDGDGVSNQDEILLGHNPGDAKDTPSSEALKSLATLSAEVRSFLSAYRWEPFQTVRRPAVPILQNPGWARNEIDCFIAAQHEKRGLMPRPEASREILLRRVYLDLIGLSPTPEERRKFLEDSSSDAYERLVDRLLEDPRYGERWGRHWMDVWRYSDWAGWSGGNQIRDSKPHIWRWRDWIVESLNGDKPYSQMIVEMLAADELAPEDAGALRATGFLVRNYKMLSREQWLEDTVKHTSQAFLGVTMGCAKCHDHMTDPIQQTEYYRLRAVFEPHQVRTDRLPGELDAAKVGLVRAYDAQPTPATYFFVRGDERKADTNRVMTPGVPRALTWEGSSFAPAPVPLPRFAGYPDRRPFVVEKVLANSRQALETAEKAVAAAQGGTPAAQIKRAELAFALAEARHEALLNVLRLEDLDEQGGKESPERRELAGTTAALQRKADLLEAKLKLEEARRTERDAAAGKEAEKAKARRLEAEKGLTAAEKQFQGGFSTDYKAREAETYPLQSSGRRLAFARWVTDNRNPLTARVAANHIWLRHFGRGLVSTPENFGANGNPPSHPELLDWLAAEFMARGWSMKALHRLILTSSTYRMTSTGDDRDASLDPDNVYLWRMPSRRLDAELVRDNLLAAAGDLDPLMGGPEIDHADGLVSKRRSLYLQIAAEKEVEFLKIFDGPAVTECYQRHPTVMPQQALALANSKIALAEARSLAARLSDSRDDRAFAAAAFERVLARQPSAAELEACAAFLRNSSEQEKRRENLALVLFNHNDFVTVR